MTSLDDNSPIALCPRTSHRPINATEKSFAARIFAVAKPMPDVPPVINAVFFLRKTIHRKYKASTAKQVRTGVKELFRHFSAQRKIRQGYGRIMQCPIKERPTISQRPGRNFAVCRTEDTADGP